MLAWLFVLAGLAIATVLLAPPWRWLPPAVALTALAWLGYRRLRGARSPVTLAREWVGTSKRRRGLATSAEVWRATGWWYARRAAGVVRPSLAGRSAWRRWRTPIRQFAFRLCRVAGGPFGAQWAYATAEEVTIRIAPPRQGKTAELCNHLIDAPGAVVATSTKVDIVSHTIALRATGLRPVHIFNPERLGDHSMRSTLRWNPVAGCQQPGEAIMRAGYLLSGSPQISRIGEHSGFWESQAVRVLSRYLHAAALAGRTMLDLLAWVSNREQYGPHVLGLLDRSPAGSSWREDFRGYLETNDDTSTSIYTTMTSALGWLNDPEVAALTSAPPGEQFDVRRFIADRGTLYLLGSDRPHGTVAPLFTCLTAHIFETAKVIASRQPGGRLDPYLTLVLDEAPLICPVPLDRWTADAGGRGIPIHIAAQSRTQLFSKWGEFDARTMWSNAAVKLIFGGIDDERELQAFAELCGYVDEDTEATSESATGTGTTTSVRRVPVMPPERIRGLKQWRALVIRRGMAPTVGRIVPVWTRRDVRAARRAERRAERQATRRTSRPTRRRRGNALEEAVRPVVTPPVSAPVPAPRQPRTGAAGRVE
jgi:type IV secretory pathway TraG/TraD family ATPase VirD4